MMEALQERFDQTLSELLPPHAHVLLAVSGGVDSIVMADLFARSRSGCTFELAHCNFQLRGADSWSDELFVANWCADRQVPLHRTTFDTLDYAREKGLSVEMAARELRYSFFARLCAEGRFDAVSIAHNANDNAETLFLNLLRGTGIKGICGMHRKTVLPVPGSRQPMIRPLLSFTRAEIEEYAQDHGQLFCVDCTNADTEYKRNRIRNLIFPQLARLNPSFLTTLGADMERFSQVDAIADSWYEERKDRFLLENEPGILLKINITALKTEKHRDFLLYRLLEPYGFRPDGLRSMLQVLDTHGTASGKTFHADGYTLLTASDAWLVLPGKEVVQTAGLECEPAPVAEGVLVRGEGAYEINGRRFHVQLMDRPAGLQLKQPAGSVLWDYDCLPFPFLLRNWQAGDWFRPIGLQGSKKLSDFFTDMKFNLVRKEKAVVVAFPEAKNGQVAAVLCLRIDDSIKVTGRTSRILTIREEMLPPASGAAAGDVWGKQDGTSR